MGIDTTTKYKVLFWVGFQLLSLHLLQGAPWYTWLFCCYTLSGSINHMMTLAMHELSHNLGSKGVMSNRFLAILGNLPMGIPAAASFKRYHMEHHKFQGEHVVDVDVRVCCALPVLRCSIDTNEIISQWDTKLAIIVPQCVVLVYTSEALCQHNVSTYIALLNK